MFKFSELRYFPNVKTLLSFFGDYFKPEPIRIFNEIYLHFLAFITDTVHFLIFAVCGFIITGDKREMQVIVTVVVTNEHTILVFMMPRQFLFEKIKGSSLRLTLVADCQLYSTVNKPIRVLFVSGSYKYHVTREKSRPIICTFQTVIIDPARSPNLSTCICSLDRLSLLAW